MRREHAVDVLLVSLGSTEGLRRADQQLQDSPRRGGARVAVARPFPQDALPTMMLTDLLWARGAREAASKIIDQQKRAPARSGIYSTTTHARVGKPHGPLRFDAPAAAAWGSAHWSAAVCAKRRCCCRGARARCARRRRLYPVQPTGARSCCR